MTKLRDDSRGVTSVLFLILIAVLIYGGYVLFFKNDSAQDASVQVTSTSETVEAKAVSDEDNHLRVISLRAVNDYDARGKVTINEDKFGQFNMQLSAVLPSEFETTYYEAHLEGDRNVNLGKLTREGGTYKLDYNSNESIDVFNRIVITVDGEAATVEGKALPHDVMVGGLN